MLTASEGPRWHVAYTGPNSEAMAARACRPIVREVFFPDYDTGSKMVRGRLVDSVRRPLFPRYLFLRFDVERDNWQRVLRAIGIERLLSYGERPQSVPEADIESLKAWARVGAFDHKEPTSESLKAGERVSVIDGPFACFAGEVLSASTPRGRVDVLLNLFGRATRARVLARQLQRAAS